MWSLAHYQRYERTAAAIFNVKKCFYPEDGSITMYHNTCCQASTKKWKIFPQLSQLISPHVEKTLVIACFIPRWHCN
jgi:hypothetical protein